MIEINEGAVRIYLKDILELEDMSFTREQFEDLLDCIYEAADEAAYEAVGEFIIDQRIDR